MAATKHMRIAGENASPMSLRFVFTSGRLDGLVCPPAKDRIWAYDERERGLALCVFRTGERSWYLKAKRAQVAHKVKLGDAHTMSLEAARRKCHDVWGDIYAGKPVTARKLEAATVPTLTTAWERYKAQVVALKRSGSAVVLETRWKSLSPLKRRRVNDITEAECQSLFVKLLEKRVVAMEVGGRTVRKHVGGPKAANNALKLLKALCQHVRYPCPFHQKAIAWTPTVSRERFLDEEQLGKLWQALGDAPEYLSDFVSLALMTGARRRNIEQMRFDEVAAADAMWTIPAAKSKNKQPIPIDLPPEAIELLQRRRQLVAGDYVFPPIRIRSDNPPKFMRSCVPSFQRVYKAAGVPHLTFHDLRRTFGSWAAANGVSLPIIAKALGHRGLGTVAIYARIGKDPVKRARLETSSSILAAAMKSATGDLPAQ